MLDATSDSASERRLLACRSVSRAIRHPQQPGVQAHTPTHTFDPKRQIVLIQLSDLALLSGTRTGALGLKQELTWLEH